MKVNSRHLGALIIAATLVTTVLKADDKPATNATSNAAKSSGGTTKIDDLFPDPVIAKGKGFEIKRSQLDDAISGMRNAAMANGHELTPSEMPLIEKNAFDHILQVDLLLPKATAADKAKATTEADDRFALLRKNNPNDEALLRQLRTMGMTIDDLHKRLIEEATAEQVLRNMIAPVTDEQVKKFYDENPSKSEQPEMVRASHILILTSNKDGSPMTDDEKKAKRKAIDDLLKRARGGEDFAKLAKQYSEDPGSKENGGEYVFPRGRMVKEFEAAAFTLQTNQISDVVTTQYGYHIIKLNEKMPAKKIELAKLAPRIKAYLEGEEVQKMLPAEYAKLKKEADVQILDQQLKTIMEAADAAMKSAPAGVPPGAPSPK